jgi:hypothetical protein
MSVLLIKKVALLALGFGAVAENVPGGGNSVDD